MRVKELLESHNFKQDDFIKHTGDKKEIDFDLVEDLIHFMNNDDDVYRRHVFPVVSKCVDLIKGKKAAHKGLFADPIKECYKAYVKKFPIRELPVNLDEKTLNTACKKFQEEISKDIKEGKYKD